MTKIPLADYISVHFPESPPQNVSIENGFIECDHSKCLHSILLTDGQPTSFGPFKFEAKIDDKH